MSGLPFSIAPIKLEILIIRGIIICIFSFKEEASIPEVSVSS